MNSTMVMEPEEWVDIEGYEGLYRISSWGRVWSYPKEWIRGKHNGKMLLGRKNVGGYLQIILFKDKKIKNFLVHRLVAEAFIPNPNNYPKVLHADDNPSNNYYKNLSWGTQKMNIDDMYSKGRANKSKSEKSPLSKLTEQQVLEIRSKYIPRKYSSRKLAKEFGVSQTIILRIISRKTWTHI